MNPVTAASLVIVGAGLEGLAQVCLKQRASKGHAGWPWLVAGVGLFLLEIGLYTRALKTLAIGVAYPLSALSYAAVVLCARVLLDERPSRRRWLGVLLVVIGAALSLPE